MPVKEIAEMVELSNNSVRATIKKIAMCEEIGVPLTDII